MATDEFEFQSSKFKGSEPSTQRRKGPQGDFETIGVDEDAIRLAARPRISRSRPVRTLALGMVVIVGALGFLAYQGLSNNLVYYITPSELLAKGAAAQGEHLRLGGQVQPGSVRWSPKTSLLRFTLQDPKGGRVAVMSRGVLPPALFHSGMGAVVEGSYGNGVFHATGLMIKHSSDYVAPKGNYLPKSDKYVHK